MRYNEALNLSGKKFVVIGAGAGIGGEACKAFRQCGADVLCVDRDEAIAKKTAEATGCTYFVADVLNQAELHAVFKHADELWGGALDGVVNVVGVSVPNWIDDYTAGDFDLQLNLVLRHAVWTAQLAHPRLKQRGGSLTFVSSIAAIRSTRKVSLYGAAKAALHQFVISASDEFGTDGIRVNAIAPGRIRNSGTVPPSAEQWEKIESAIPLRRAGVPSEMAGAILFLASDLSSYVTGHILVADGGISGVSALPSTLVR